MKSKINRVNQAIEEIKKTSRTCSQMTYVEQSKSQFFVMKTLTHCARVSKAIFSSKEWPVFVVGTAKIKFNSSAGTRAAFRERWLDAMSCRAEKLVAQSLLTASQEYVSRAINCFYRMYQMCNNIRRQISLFIEIASFSMERNVVGWFADIALLLIDLAIQPQVSGLQLVVYLLRIYKIFINEPFSMHVQSWEGLLFSIVSMGLPQNLVEIIRRISQFTQVKLLEDVTIIHQFLTVVTDTVKAAILKIPGMARFTDFLEGMWSGVAEHHFLLMQANRLYRKWKNNKRVLVDAAIRAEILDVQARIDANDSLQDWARSSAAVNKRLADFKILAKLTGSYENNMRSEPVCIAFEGPAGCFKSRYMGMLIDVLGLSVYTHQIKSLGDGKDFYDQYDGQDIFAMDDLGQGGPSQYRTLFNLVSPIKYPLECANEKLKDTKFFSSEAILFTTNSFMNINSVTKQDGIVDIKALWRRVVVIDFAKVRRDVAKGTVSGKVSIRSFNMSTNKFELGYPGISLLPDTIEIAHEDNFLVWLGKHYKNLKRIKQSHFEDNLIEEERKKDLRTKIDSAGFELQGGQRLDECDYTRPSSGKNVREFFIDPSIPEAEFILKGYQSAAPLFDMWDSLEMFMEHPVMRLEILQDGGRFRDGDERDLEHTMRWTMVYMNMVRQRFEGSLREKIKPPWYQTWFKAAKDGLIELLSSWDFWIPLLCTILLQLVAILASYIVTRLCAQGGEEKPDWEPIRLRTRPSTSMNEALSQQVYSCDFIKDDRVDKAVGIVSGHYVICPRHAARDSKFLSIHSHVEGCKLLDHAPVTVVYNNSEEDVCILKIDRNVMVAFKQVHKVFAYNSPCHTGKSLVTPVGVVPLITDSARVDMAVIDIFGVKKYLTEDNSVKYDLSLYTMCGSPLVDNGRGVIGCHIAGSTNQGRALVWSEATRRHILSVISEDQMLLNSDIKPSNIPSGIKLDLNFHQSTPKETNIVQSPLFGCLGEPLKEPVDLSKGGPHYIKDLFKKSTNQVKDVRGEDLEFGRQYLRSIIEPFSPISEEQVVCGYECVAPINMKAATGIGCYKDRAAYFQDGRYTEAMKEALSKLKSQALSGNIDPMSWVAKETLKDEVRSVSKQREPRTFRVLPLPVNILCKQLTGDMVNSLVKRRHEHGIMVGLNPYEEWDLIYRRLSKHKVIAADIKKFDGNMLPQVQYAVRDVLLEKFQGTEEDKIVLGVVLTSMICNLVAVNDDVYLSTHSMPSGCYLTAIVNSLVHKMYTAMWYNHVMPKATIGQFYADIEDLVYGDDKLCAVKRVDPRLTAITMRDYFRLIGLDLSTADKKEITEPYDSWDEVNFLKRQFKYHAELKKIMCPLVDDTIKTMLYYTDVTKDFSEVFQGKLNSFSVESYLRDDCDYLRKQVEESLVKAQLPYTLWSKSRVEFLLREKQVESPYIFHL